MANFGIGVGAFTDGFARGMGMRDQINARNEQKEKKKAFKEAEGAYDKAIADDVMAQAGQADPNQPFDVEAAKNKSALKIGSLYEFIQDVQMPKIVDAYIKQGDLEGAQGIQAMFKDAKYKRDVEKVGKSLNLFAAGQFDGNYEPFAESVKSLVNSSNQGVSVDSFELLKGEDGSTSGINFTLEQDGRKFNHVFTSMQEAGDFLSSQIDPTYRYAQLQKQTAQADALKAEQAKEMLKQQGYLARDTHKFGLDVARDERKSQLDAARDLNKTQATFDSNVALETHKANEKLRVESEKSKDIGSKTQREYDATVSIMKNAGFTDNEVKSYIPAILKIDGERKSRSIEEYTQTIMMELIKDPMNARKPTEELRATAYKLAKATQEVANQIKSDGQAINAATGIGGQSPQQQQQQPRGDGTGIKRLPMF